MRVGNRESAIEVAKYWEILSNSAVIYCAERHKARSTADCRFTIADRMTAVSLLTYQLIAYTPYVHDLYGGIMPEVFAEVGDEHIEAAAAEEIIIAPDMEQDGFAVHDLVFIEQEEPEQFCFAGSERYSGIPLLQQGFPVKETIFLSDGDGDIHIGPVLK